jgi:predicted RNase H-like HicB family nuclease
LKYEKVQEDGMQKKVTEQYVVDAVSFSEAEQRIMEEMAQYISGELEVANINPAPFGEVFFADGDVQADKWYKAKLQFVTIDEKTAKEKKSNVTYLVQAASLEDARKNIDEVMQGTMIDYVTVGVNETPIMDVFEHQAEQAD